MKRRETFRLLPLTLAGMIPLTQSAFTGDMACKQHMPEPKLPLGIRYTLKVREMLEWIRRTQSENLLEAAYAIARTVKNGGTCWCSWDMGHNTMFDMFPDRNGNPGIFTMGYDPQKTKKGDLFLASIWGGPHEDLVKKEIFVIGGPAPWGSDAKLSELIERDSAKHRLRPYSHIWIETNITTLGAIMKVPGSPAPTGPVSGILGMLTFWMMQADACRILARDGITLNVQGDEPKLTDANWCSLDAPLMDDYFDTVMNQIELIGSEFGNIREIARMAVDSVLVGGKVYCYSRYRNSLSVEGQSRRGGLMLTKGVHRFDGGNKDLGKLISFDGDFKGTKKDTVIMGISKPDDEYDLLALETFRKCKMKIASMGPITRNIRIPEGRIVPKETDIHVGRMCDTYGLFAVPGFNRNVCPTSGALINQMWWALCMEIAGEIMRRTGNTPGIYFSAALKDAQDYNNLGVQKYLERGY